jgi:hypothetical protein
MLQQVFSYWEKREFQRTRKLLVSKYKEDFILKTIFFPISECNERLSERNLFDDITLILDIDQTLGFALERPMMKNENYDLWREKYDEILELIKKEKVEIIHGNMLFIKRPNFEQFIKFCNNNFKEIIIWTNGTDDHAKMMVNMIEKIINKKTRGYSRSYSVNSIKLIEKLGLNPVKTWMVDDDISHYHAQKNNGFCFYDTPNFAFNTYKISDIISLWSSSVIELYDDWFLFLIWNWHYMKKNKLNPNEYFYDKYNNTFIKNINK